MYKKIAISEYRFRRAAWFWGGVIFVLIILDLLNTFAGMHIIFK